MKSGILLLSGGFDSVVAGYLMKKKGLKIIALHCSLEPLVDDLSVVKAKKLSELLGIELHLIKIGVQLGEISKNTNPRYYFVMQKRFLLRLAEEMAKRKNCDCIITGENLGQVSSQTLQNISVVEDGAKLPILRPLLCYDKKDILKLARLIGSHDLSVGKEMCDVLGPKNPVTRAKIDIVYSEETRFDSNRLVKMAFESITG